MTRVSSRTNKGVHTHAGDSSMYYGSGNKRELELDGEEGPDSVKKSKTDLQSLPTEEGDVRCTPCGATKENYNELTDKGGIMIECEVCKTWQHASCMGYKTKKTIPSIYKCNICNPEMAAKVASLEQTSRISNMENTSKSTATETQPVSKNSSSKDSKAKKESDSKILKPFAKPNSKPDMKPNLPAEPVPVIRTIEQHLKDKTRVSVAKAFYNVFKRHFPENYKFPEGSNAEIQAVKFALQLEHEILEFSNPKEKKYTEKSRTLVVLVKKPNVMSRIMNGNLNFKAIVNSSPEEIDEDLKKYAEKVREELIRRSVLTVEDETLQRVRRTHKGEEIVEDSASHGGDLYGEVNIETRSVDHRRFNMEDRAPENKIIVSDKMAKEVFRDDDDDDDETIGTSHGSRDENINLSAQKQSQDDGIPDLEDDELDFILRDDEKTLKKGSNGTYGPRVHQETIPSGLDNSKKSSNNSLPSLLPSNVWNGDIVFPDFVLFSADVSYVGCANSLAKVDTANGILQYNRQIKITKEIFGLKKYEIEGRLDRRTADLYLRQTTISRDLYVVEINGIGYDFDKLSGYLRDHKKAGVLSGKPSFVKDAYLISGGIPDFLAPLKLNPGSLYGIFLVKKDYNPVTKSILKRSEPVVKRVMPEKPTFYQQRPPSIPSKPEVNPLSSILSKLQ